MASLWVDRLAEVWASPGRAGAGVVVGSDGVLTARHVVAGALAGGEARLLARIVRPGRSVGLWAPMRAVWEDQEWDLALLRLDGESQDARVWEAPESSTGRVVVVELGMTAASGCEAVGFPESAVQHARSEEPAEVVRQTEQAVGTVLPAGQGKPPVNPQRKLPRRWLPLDLDTTPAHAQAGWSGMSGAGVVLPDGRLIGLAVDAEADHDRRRLYVVPLADALSASPALGQMLDELAGGAQAMELRDAPLYRRVCQTDSLGTHGFPRRVADISRLEVFGVKPADVPGEPTYLSYVPRDDDEALREALRDAIDSRRMLLVVGGAGAGKSRSTAEAVRDLLPQHRFIRPRSGLLRTVSELPLDDLAPAVVWLDEVQEHAHPPLSDTLEALLHAGFVLVGTIRREELKRLTPPGDVRNPAGEALDNQKLVRQANWRLEWSDGERVRLREHVRYAAVLQAVSKGIPLGVYVVGGPLLVRRLETARFDEEHPLNYALVRIVLDWYRTGIGEPVAVQEAVSLLRIMVMGDETVAQNELDEALEWAADAVMGAVRKTRQSLVTREETGALRINEYLLDHHQHEPKNVVPKAIWHAALCAARSDKTTQSERLWRIGAAAYEQRQHDVALSAMRVLADLGQALAVVNVGALLSDTGRSKEAVAVSDQLLARFADAPTFGLRDYVASALLIKGVALTQLHRREEALVIYDHIIRRFADLREQVAKALINKGIMLGTPDRSQEEIAVYDELLARFADAPEPALREQVANALLNKGVTLGALGRSEDAVAVYDELLARFADAPEPALRERVATALANKGVALGHLNRRQEAVAVFDQVETRFADAPEHALREQVATALANKGVALGHLNRRQEAVAVFDQVETRFADAPEHALRERVATALLNKGVALGDLGRPENEIAVYDEMNARFADAPELGLREQVATALVHKGLALAQLNRRQEAVAVFDQVETRFADAPEHALREQVGKALINKGVVLSQLNRRQEAVAVFDQVETRFADARELALREQVAKALIYEGLALSQLGCSDDEIGVYEQLLLRFADAPESALREQVGKALINKGVVLSQLNRRQEAVAVLDQLITQFADAPESALREQVATALLYKVGVLGELGRGEEAVAVLDQLITRFADAPEPAITEVVERARRARRPRRAGIAQRLRFHRRRAR